MDLPINDHEGPYRHKYLTQETRLLAHWFVFGSSAPGSVDIGDPFGDVIIRVPQAKAERIVRARNAFCAVIEDEMG